MYHNTVVVLVSFVVLYQTCGELANIPPTEQTTRKKTEDRRESKDKKLVFIPPPERTQIAIHAVSD